MAVVAGRTQIGLKDTSSKANVPNNDKARLMFYLNCVCTLLKLDDPEINRLRRYNDYRLTDEQTDALIALCYLLSPDVLLDKCIFHSEELCGDSSNKFFDLTLAQTHLAVTDSILIGGQKRQVQKIMTFKRGWIERNWGEPLKNVLIQRKQEKERERQNQRQQQLQQQREQQQKRRQQLEQERQRQQRQEQQSQHQQQQQQIEQQQLQLQQLQLQLRQSQQHLDQLEQQQQQQQQQDNCCCVIL